MCQKRFINRNRPSTRMIATHHICRTTERQKNPIRTARAQEGGHARIRIKKRLANPVKPVKMKIRRRRHGSSEERFE